MPLSSLKTPHHYPTPWGRANPRPHFFAPGGAQNAANAWKNLCWSWARGRARHPALFLGSSVVEQPAVNRLVAGSIPARGAIFPRVFTETYGLFSRAHLRTIRHRVRSRTLLRAPFQKIWATDTGAKSIRCTVRLRAGAPAPGVIRFAGWAMTAGPGAYQTPAPFSFLGRAYAFTLQGPHGSPLFRFPGIYRRE